MDNNSQVSELPTSTRVLQSEWKTIGVGKISCTLFEVNLLNRHTESKYFSIVIFPILYRIGSRTSSTNSIYNPSS